MKSVSVLKPWVRNALQSSRVNLGNIKGTREQTQEFGVHEQQSHETLD